MGGAGGRFAPHRPLPPHPRTRGLTAGPWSRGRTHPFPRPLSPALLSPRPRSSGSLARPTARARGRGTARPARLQAGGPGRGPPTPPRGRRPRGPWRLRTRCRGWGGGAARQRLRLQPRGEGVRPPLKGTSWPPTVGSTPAASSLGRGDLSLWVGGGGLGRARWAGSLGSGGARRAPDAREGTDARDSGLGGNVSWGPQTRWKLNDSATFLPNGVPPSPSTPHETRQWKLHPGQLRTYPPQALATGTPQEGRDATGGDVASEYQAEEEGRRLRSEVCVPGGRGTGRGQRKDLAGDRESSQGAGVGAIGARSLHQALPAERKQDRSLDSSE